MCFEISFVRSLFCSFSCLMQGVHWCDIFDGNHITIKLNGFLINFNGCGKKLCFAFLFPRHPLCCVLRRKKKHFGKNFSIFEIQRIWRFCLRISKENPKKLKLFYDLSVWSEKIFAKAFGKLKEGRNISTETQAICKSKRKITMNTQNRIKQIKKNVTQVVSIFFDVQP